MTETLVKISALSVRRGERLLFADLSLAAEVGAHVALTGPNGSGKTSLLRAIAGFLKPAAGEIEVGPAGPETSAHYLGHRDGLKSTLSALAHARFWRDLLGGTGDPSAALDAVGLTRQRDLPARALSAGQSRRLALARLLISPRPVWLLDEPAAALDAAGRRLLGDLIAAHRREGGLVVAAVHEPLGEPSATLDLGAYR